MTESSQFKRCLISGSEDLHLMKGYENHYLVKSKPIGFVFCNKIPTEKELIKHYQKYQRTEIVSDLTITRYNELLDKFEKYRKTNKILDVGCGTGLFLDIAKKRGWDVYGTEFTDDAITICDKKSIKMSKGKLNTKNYTESMFDVITSFEVLEHINNPTEEVQNMNKLLRKNGLLYFTTPNFNAIERFILKSDYNIIEYPEHLCYYTPKTIHYLLTRNGFKKIKSSTTGFSLQRVIKSKENSLSETKNSDLNKSNNKDEQIRQSLEKNRTGKLIKSFINYFLNILGVGNSLKGFYEKV